jgi:hypothetical protein
MFSTEEPKRDNVFYVEFPAKWQTQDIFDLFSPFGSVFVGWINESSAFVAIQNLENVKKAAGQLVGVSGRDYRVYFYTTYINQLSKGKGNTRAMINNQSVVNNSPNTSGNNKSANGNSKEVIAAKKLADEEATAAKEKRKRGEKVGGGKRSEDSSSGSDADLKKIKKEYFIFQILISKSLMFNKIVFIKGRFRCG